VVCVQIVDNGPGVPKAELSRVTKRFARLESARSTEGHGLGLSLVTAVARLHQGRLVLRNAGPGLSAIIELPRAAETILGSRRQIEAGEAPND
jgi:signal transduction histidine kinase